jgi:hypothetical protein
MDTFKKDTFNFFYRLINDEMESAAKKSKAFQGIECVADYVPVDYNIWMVPLLPKRDSTSRPQSHGS